MADNRITTVYFGASKRAKAPALHQYDYGQTLSIKGVTLPDAYEVHFSNSEYGGTTTTVLGNADGVAIPDAYLQSGTSIFAWIYLHDSEDDGETEYKIEIPVFKRPKPTNETPTPVQQDAITQAIAALNAGVERAEQAADGIEETIETALQEAKDSGEFDGEDGLSLFFPTYCGIFHVDASFNREAGSITIPFGAYKGAQMIPCHARWYGGSDLPAQITQATASSLGSITISWASEPRYSGNRTVRIAFDFGGITVATQQKFIVVNDGAKGVQGEQGDGAPQVIMTLESFPALCNATGAIKTATGRPNYFIGLIGDERVDCSVKSVTCMGTPPAGIDVYKVSDSTPTTSGMIIVQLNPGAIPFTSATNLYQWRVLFDVNGVEVEKMITVYQVMDGATGRKGDKGDSWYENSRITSLDNTQLVVGAVIEAIGAPVYVKNIETYSEYGITQTGWYVFARINAKGGVSVTGATTITGAAGQIVTVGASYVDVAVRFGSTAESQTVVVNWGESAETFVFKAGDLAVRNLDYRTTFYLYDLDEFVIWTYALTTDTAFVANKSYYTKDGDVYTLAEVTVGESIPADTYYNHSKARFEGMTRNVTYKLDTIIDCPFEIVLPEVDDEGYGAWFEFQLRYLGSHSCTLLPPEGVKIGTVTTQNQTAGINVIDLQYTGVGGVKMWSLLNTHSNIPA